jgi:acyl-CoA reductase-like NAD-dependent aldehyde dehydrogenase
VLEYLRSGEGRAALVTGGSAQSDKGCYVKLTTLYKPEPDADIVTEEILGPVVTVKVFKSEGE